MKDGKKKLFEMMERVNPDYNRPEKSGIEYEELPAEDQILFKQLFDIDNMRGAHGPDYDGNYIKVNKFWRWDSPEGKQFKSELEKEIQQFNSQSQNYDMILKGLQDWETDDDRNWDASYTFTFIPKQ